MQGPARLLWLSLALSAPARAGELEPEGESTAQRLLAGDSDGASAREVKRAVQRHGFYAGEPIGAGACAGCHADVARQWEGSAHRFASFNNPYYAVAVEQFRRDRGNKASRFCADCHDPALIAGGAADRTMDRTIDPATREAQAGIVCLVCHSIDQTPPRTGNGRFHATVGTVITKGPEHAARLRPPLLATPDLCGGCHKVGLGPEVTNARWLRGQDDLDPFIASSISGNGAGAIHRAKETSRCQDCHMPLTPAVLGDAGAKRGADGVARIRSHRFLGANAALPHLRGDQAGVKRVTEFLSGKATVELSWQRDDEVDVVLRSRGVGHRFPGGTMDSNEVWLEVEARGADGKLLGRSGAIDARGQLDVSAHLVRGQMVDGDGRPLERRDVQFARGVVYDTSLQPGDPQAVRYQVPGGTAEVRARLLYRKFTAGYARLACAKIPDGETRRRCLDVPVIEMARAGITRPRGDPADVAARCSDQPWESVLDHGIALASAMADRAGEAEAWLECARTREPKRPEPLLGLARMALVLGRTDDVVRFTEQASLLGHDSPAALLLRVRALLSAYRYRDALGPVERLLARLPGDPAVLSLVSRTRGLVGDPAGSLAAADRLLVVDPESDDGHYQRSLALRELGRPKEADAAEAFYLTHRVATEENLRLRAKFRARYPGRADESMPVHVHPLTPLPRYSSAPEPREGPNEGS